MKYRLKIKTKNKTFIVRGKPVRTPLTIDNLNEKELNFYLSKIRLEGILDKDYEIQETTGKTSPNIETKKHSNKNKTSENEELIDEEDKSTLEKILEDNNDDE